MTNTLVLHSEIHYQRTYVIRLYNQGQEPVKELTENGSKPNNIIFS